MARFLSLKIGILSLLIYLICAPGAYAAPGCCSHHGGVNGCNNATNHQLCQDGTSSPTCLCTGGTSSNTPIKSKKVVTPKTTSRSTTVTNKKATVAPAAAPTTPAKQAKTASSKAKGCCSQHGGVGKCDKRSGYKKCKDGTISSTCKCK